MELKKMETIKCDVCKKEVLKTGKIEGMILNLDIEYYPVYNEMRATIIDLLREFRFDELDDVKPSSIIKYIQLQHKITDLLYGISDVDEIKQEEANK